MNQLFYFKNTFNDDISTWDTSQVTNMAFMFEGASAFNQAVGSWDTSKVTTMYGMFYYASAFNQAVGSWDTSKVTTMYGMFYSASSFNQNLCQWRSAFPYNNADDIFANSNCTNKATPVDANGGENWCAETTCN